MLRNRIVTLCTLLIAANALAWGWALNAFHGNSVLLGTAVLAYGLGLRHAVDADHIAAIDNVTRNLLQRGRRPVGVGLFFSLGHSTVVVMASLAVALTASAYRRDLENIHVLGGIVGTLVSAVFLFAIAAMNLVVLRAVYRKFRQMRAGEMQPVDDPGGIAIAGGFLARLFRPLFGLISQSWHMYPLGILFGLGFDTATEISLLGISAAEGAKGLSIWSMLIFPALFAAGMSLIDAADSVMMLGAYGWAFVRPLRKLYYNMTVTFVSVLVAVTVGGIETLGLIGRHWELRGQLWNLVQAANDHFGTLGYVIVGVFAGCWIFSALIYRVRGYDKLETTTAPAS